MTATVSIVNKANSIISKAKELWNLPLREGARITPLGWGESYECLRHAEWHAQDAAARAESGDRRGARRALRAAVALIAEARLGLVPAP